MSGALLVGSAWAAGLLVLYLLGKVLSALTLCRLDLNNPSRPVPPWLRGLYRAVIREAGIYYYASVLVLIGLVLAVPAAILTRLAAMPRIPPMAAWAALPLGMLIPPLVVPLMRALRGRLVDLAPGCPLRANEAPLLWELSREVARRVGTLPVDEVRLTVGTAIAVWERGRPRDRRLGRTRRTLMLGMGAFDGLSVAGFRAVLAHEYGHFLHRDTAGGDVALRVLASLEQLGAALWERGQARWWNLSWHFVRLYHRLFRRLAFGASRLQELRADAVAAQACGAEACARGLRETIRRDVEYGCELGRAFEDTLRDPVVMTPPLRSRHGIARRRIEARLAAILAAPTADDQTHPAPADRLRFFEQAQADEEAQSAKPAETRRLVWDLFAEPGLVRAEYRRRFDADVQNRLDEHAIHFDWVIACCTAAIHDAPGAPAPYYHRAEAYAELGDDQAALADYDRALTRGGPDALCSFRRAQARSRLGRHGVAAEDFRSALRIDPQSFGTHAHVGLADLQARRGDYEQAIAEYGRALEQVGDVADLLVRRGNARIATGDLQGAIDDLTRALEADPDLAEALVARSVAYRARGEHGRALADAEQAVARDARLAEAHTQLALLLTTCPEASLRDGPRSLRHARRGVKLGRGRDPAGLEALAAAYAAVGDDDRAAAWGSRAHRLADAGIGPHLLRVPPLSAADEGTAETASHLDVARRD